jgi:hypothetical protein
MVLMYFNKSQQRNKDKNIPIGKQGHLTWMLEGRDVESQKKRRNFRIFQKCNLRESFRQSFRVTSLSVKVKPKQCIVGLARLPMRGDNETSMRFTACVARAALLSCAS